MIRFLHTASQPIGLDLGADCIKMIQLERNGGGLRVTAAAQYYFPPDLAPDSPERRQMAVTAVRQMHRRNGFRGRRVISAISDGDLVIKTIRVPEGTPQEMQEAIAQEAAKRLPFDASAARVEHLDVGRVQQGNETCHEIILLAVPQEGIQAEIDLLTDMGLEPVAFDVGPCALFRGRERLLMRREDRDEVSLLVDIGATSTKVVIGHGPDIAFIKTIAVGGRDINQAVAASLDLSLREAVSLRESLARGPRSDGTDDSAAGQDPSQEVLAACEPVLAQLAKEISLCLRYHAVTFRGYRPATVQVSGGEARHPLTMEYLGRALTMRVVKADPLKHMNTSHVDIGQSRRQPAPCWMLSTGLALRGLIPTATPDRGGA
jgi:type IV pilus assembly protein PilM